MPSIREGDPAPDFAAVTHTGETISLAQFRDRSAVVLFFYPRDESPICTKEVCSFRDSYEDFVDAGAVVIGVSGDDAESHRSFVASQRLPFPLISDTDGALRKAFGVPKTLGLLPGRVTYVIARQGIVQLVFSAQLASAEHMERALEVVRRGAQNTRGV
jgi:peroxiredoxin Q/BCP